MPFPGVDMWLAPTPSEVLQSFQETSRRVLFASVDWLSNSHVREEDRDQNVAERPSAPCWNYHGR